MILLYELSRCYCAFSLLGLDTDTQSVLNYSFSDSLIQVRGSSLRGANEIPIMTISVNCYCTYREDVPHSSFLSNHATYLPRTAGVNCLLSRNDTAEPMQPIHGRRR